MPDAADNQNVESGENIQEQQHELSDDDSALGDELPSSTRSLTSSVWNYTYENGRRYHAFRAGVYFMPNDEEEQDSMDLWHHISSMILEGELFRAPVVDPQSILEIGTGTGIWAINVADKFPAAEVIATDLSPIQPSWVPPNLNFQIDDCESEWQFSQKFDFIHMRNLSGSIADWPKLLGQAFAQLTPGGWIEVSNVDAMGQSYNGSIQSGTAAFEWQERMLEATTQFGRPIFIGPQLHQLIRSAGFENVMEDTYKIPMSRWVRGRKQKELATWFYHLACRELESMSLALFTRVLGWEPDRLQVLLAAVRNEIKDPKNQMYSNVHYVYGRKPGV